MIIFVTAFFTGLLSKLVDAAEEHGLGIPAMFSRVSGVAYGVLIAYVISVSPELSGLWIATVIGVIITGKIDTPGHYLGIGSMLFMLPILGIAGIDVPLLAAFTALCVLEEVINDEILDKGRIKNRAVSGFLGMRPLLEMAAFVVSAAAGQWVIWLGLLSYDVGYVLMERLAAH
ncbi:MAG: hypothetical protein DRO99_03515 [Candidatus Aenigmatarchaeota archaeon]|nr:MAG: hypothetical protein DRO99_03515 [Candidatus Aenigmarchaeota archaeon]